MLKVLYVSNSVGIGGAENSLLDMIESLKEKVIPVVVVPTVGFLTEVLLEKRINYYVVPFSLSYGGKGTDTEKNRIESFINNYDAAKKIVEICNAEKVNIIHTNSFTGNVGAIASVLSGIPHIWHLRELLEEHYEKEIWDRPLKRDLLNSSQGVITISDYVGKAYKDKYGCGTITIYNAIDEQRYYNPLLNDNNNRNFMLSASKITRSKGQRDAVLAVEYLNNHGVDNIKLYIIGNAAGIEGWCLKTYTRKKNIHNIFFIDTMYDLSEYRAKCEYALTTSKCEALGRVTIEAMYAGNVVIGAKSGGTEEIIGDSELHGYLYESGDYISLAMAMNRALETDNRTLRMQAQQYALDNFSKDVFSKKIYSIYSKCIYNNVPMNDELKKELNNKYSNIKIKYSTYPRVIQKKKDCGKSILRDDLLKKIDALEMKGVTIPQIIEEKVVSIYGFGIVGRRIYEALIDSSIKVINIYDKRVKDCFGFDILDPERIVDEMNTVIVSIVGEPEITANCEKMGIKAISFEDLVNNYFE